MPHGQVYIPTDKENYSRALLAPGIYRAIPEVPRSGFLLENLICVRTMKLKGSAAGGDTGEARRSDGQECFAKNRPRQDYGMSVLARFYLQDASAG